MYSASRVLVLIGNHSEFSLVRPRVSLVDVCAGRVLLRVKPGAMQMQVVKRLCGGRTLAAVHTAAAWQL